MFRTFKFCWKIISSRLYCFDASNFEVEEAYWFGPVRPCARVCVRACVSMSYFVYGQERLEIGS